MKSLYVIPIILAHLIAVSGIGCCHDRAEERRAAAAGISPETNAMMMRDSPLYRYAMTNGGDYRSDTKRFLDKIKKETTSGELQAWAVTVLDANKDRKDSFDLPESQIPTFVLNLDRPLPASVTVYPNSYITIYWGGGFGFWGLFVGGKDSPPPVNPTIYCIEWASGVQVFHDIQ